MLHSAIKYVVIKDRFPKKRQAKKGHGCGLGQAGDGSEALVQMIQKENVHFLLIFFLGVVQKLW